MQVSNIRFSNFRNYKDCFLDFNPELNIFFGDNGEGKTSLLEAIHVILKGKSFQPYTKFHFIKDEEIQSSIQINLINKEGEKLQIQKNFYKTKEGVKIKNFYFEKETKRFPFLKDIQILVFTAEKLKAIKGGMEERRKLIDDILIYNNKAKVIKDFEKILKQKTKLIRNYKKNLISYEEAKKVLKVLNIQFTQISYELTKERYLLIEDIKDKLNIVTKELFKKPHPNLDIKYKIAGKNIRSQDEIARAINEGSLDKKDLELEAGTLLFGPQKDEIFLFFNGKDSRFFCSQGEQRLFVFCLMATQIHEGTPPLVFLDDILSELDKKIRKNLICFLEKRKIQVFLTSCEELNINTKKGSFFTVKNATIAAV